MKHVAVDLHCHVLPGLDDGAADLADAVEMARQAQADGIEAICATPHIRHDHAVDVTELDARVRELSATVAASDCPVRVLPGAEVAASALDRLGADELATLTLGGSGRWILLEPDPGPLDDRLDHALLRVQRAGFRAVIAHPERHLAADLPARLRRLIDGGALVQATGASLTDRQTRPGMLELARDGLIQVLGSDSHSSRAGRPVALAGALAALGEIDRLRPNLEWIADTAPRAIIAGQELESPF